MTSEFKKLNEERLDEVRLEDDYLYVGTFWLVGKSIKDILIGNFEVVGEKHLVNFEGKNVDPINRNSLKHKRLWRDDEKLKQQAFKISNVLTDDYTYFPRGRVIFYNKEYYIFLPNDIFNNPKVIGKLSSFYSLNKRIEINIEINDETEDELQADHYEYKLN